MFAKYCEHTYANDCDPEKIKIAANNLNVYQGYDMNVTFMCSDFLTLSQKSFNV